MKCFDSSLHLHGDDQVVALQALIGPERGKVEIPGRTSEDGGLEQCHFDGRHKVPGLQRVEQDSHREAEEDEGGGETEAGTGTKVEEGWDFL